MYPYQLEKGSKKYTCPQCGAKKKFRRVIESATGHYLPDHVGRCDRESSCGYEYTWKDYFADNPELGRVTSVRKMSTSSRPRSVRKSSASKRMAKPGSIQENGSQSDSKARFSNRKPDYLEKDQLLRTLTDYDKNTFVQFLIKLFPNDPEDVIRAVKDYLIGTKDGFTVFSTITRQGRVCKAKLIQFDQTGHTLKRPNGSRVISSLEARIKKAGNLPEDFETNKEVFFGEHLLPQNSDLPIAIVEAEKTAVIASICRGALPPNLVWLATGSKQWLKVSRLRRLGRDRTIILFPDADGFDKWQEIASDASKRGLTVKVSDLIENRATDEEKRNGADLADYLIRDQRKRNDPAVRDAFRDLIEERLAIMTIDGEMSEERAEFEIIQSGFYQNALQFALCTAS